jgi:hypothetical protein
VRYVLTFGILSVAGLAIRQLKGSAGGENRRTELYSLALASLTIVLCIYHNIYDGLLIAPAAMAAFENAVTVKTQRQSGFQWLLCGLLLVPAFNYSTSARFVAFVAELMPALASAVQPPSVWTILCVLNGVCLTIAWIVLLFRYLGAADGMSTQALK